ncbi:TetR family transcriptional regulator [Nocardia otitidiscaviarum]|uniref:TetR family transcriptional regulator n=1 Tax=Nocardia otitidiscaviarum TaxID=1823 RepID=UPI0006942AAF|nr:TetR family transcriptional regulator [Nocardia otitidiscaviarum]MBF6132285.1 TetR family transcriptional regulator [Nocardia otitidiscaviarum]MBF6483377.1 TetR family transcriptional regulator [Nocardia otitidiscaviarum]
MNAPAKRSDATRRALLRAARAEFAEYGLAGARVDRIAEAAGVNKERIYGLFGSKDKLFDVILIDTMREFLEVVQPLSETEPGKYVGKLFDYHREHPQLLRLLLWEGLHRGADAHDIDGWRAEHYVRKFERAQEQFGVDERRAGLVLLALCGLANWSLAVPQTARLLLGAAADDTEATKRFMADFARSAMRGGRADLELVNELTGAGSVPLRDSNVSEGEDRVDVAARRLREAQAAAAAAREELAAALRASRAGGTSANQLARQVAGTLSRPVVLKLLADPDTDGGRQPDRR